MKGVASILCLALACPMAASGLFGQVLARSDASAVTSLGERLDEALKGPLDGLESPPSELLRRRAVHLPLGGLAAALFAVGFSLRARKRPRQPRRGRRGEPPTAAAPPRARPRGARRRIAKRARVIEQHQGAVAAGDFLVSEGLRDEAAELFLRRGEFSRVAELRHDQNRFEEAAELYERAGKPEAAAAIYARLSRYSEAARCYLSVDKRSVAAEMFERGDQLKDAGRCYLESGFYQHAADCLQRANCEGEAADALLAWFEEERRGVARGAALNPELESIAKRAADLLAGVGRIEEAEDVLMKAGAYGPAAKMAMGAGAYDRAADLYLKLDRPDLAAEACERSGDVLTAAKLRGAYLRDQGEMEAAAREMRKAEQWEEAGDLFRHIGRFTEAGDCYLAGGETASAAEMFHAGGESEQAAEAFERAGNFERAAECYALLGDYMRYAELLERGGRIFEAGSAHADHGSADEAIRLLQRIEASDENFSKACVLLGRLFGAKGMESLSIKKLEQATAGERITRDTVEVHYELGRALAKRGKHATAIEVFDKILAFDYHYRDVSDLLDEAKTKRREETNPNRALAISGSGQRYEIQRELGRGGMGVVYLARDTVLDRDVAYKVLPEGVRSNANALKCFLREAKAAAQLNHPNIVTVYDAGESEHGFYLAMEFIDGTNLKDILQRQGALEAGSVLYVVREMAEALDYAHHRRVVHRDVKTANTMWSVDKKVKIMDFGLAKVMQEVRNATTLVSGTPYYMSPEQTLGRNVDYRTDVYSLGVTTFELATGRLPFRKGNVPYHHVHTPPPEPRSIRPEIHEELEAIILKCLEKDPENRFQSAREIVDAVNTMTHRSRDPA